MAENSNAISSTAMMPAGVDNESTARPRNRRGPNSRNAQTDRNTSASHLTPGPSPTPSRGISPIPSARLNSGTNKLSESGRSSPVTSSFSRGLLEGSWAPSWTQVQDFASSLLAGAESGYNSETSQPNSRSGSKSRQRSMWRNIGNGGGGGRSGSNRRLSDTWGPEPPTSRPKADDIAAGSLEEREAALKALKTASVLESHDGVNGGLDVTGKFKRRNSDENLRDSGSDPIVEEHLVYLHHVQPDDTYAGIVLRYRCQEHALRTTNGLWTRDNIQVRKFLLVPVDACETKGRPCDPPNFYNQKVDLLATTPQPESYIQSGKSGCPDPQHALHDDYFSSKNRLNQRSQSLPEEEQPWTHVRWVKIDGIQHPVEIVRVARKAMGFFPPRRKKSIHTASVFSTPRHSVDLSRGIGSSEPTLDSPDRLSLRRQSSLSFSARPTAASLGTASPASRSRGDSLGPADGVPSWMRRPGGVGSMSRSVKAPGPAKDSLNNWVNKRMPGLNIDRMPSMSVMGSESAHWGFSSKHDEAPGIVESPFEEGRDASLSSKQGIGLEQAAATIETWLRGAWAKKPTTPRMGSHRRPAEDLDLIELTDANSDDGGQRTPLRISDPGLLSLSFEGTTGRSNGEGAVRGRSTTGPSPSSSGAKGKKDD